MSAPMLHNARELEQLAETWGMLPFFACGAAGFSIQDHTPASLWFAEGVDGPWEWRMDVARSGRVAYGKLFAKKAGLVSRAFYPDLANYRRRGYDFDARYEEGLCSHSEKVLMDLLEQNGPMLSRDLKRAAAEAGVGKGFDAALTALQMQTYVTVHSFDYLQDRYGKPYGWGVARYALTEDVLGPEVTRSAYARAPEESFVRLLDRLRALCPGTEDAVLRKLLK